MSLGNETKRNGRYYYSNLGNRFTIMIYENEYYVMLKDVDGSLITLSNGFSNLEQSKLYLVNWININMKVDFPNLTVA